MNWVVPLDGMMLHAHQRLNTSARLWPTARPVGVTITLGFVGGRANCDSLDLISIDDIQGDCDPLAVWKALQRRAQSSLQHQSLSCPCLAPFAPSPLPPHTSPLPPSSYPSPPPPPLSPLLPPSAPGPQSPNASPHFPPSLTPSPAPHPLSSPPGSQPRSTSPSTSTPATTSSASSSAPGATPRRGCSRRLTLRSPSGARARSRRWALGSFGPAVPRHPQHVISLPCICTRPVKHHLPS